MFLEDLMTLRAAPLQISPSSSTASFSVDMVGDQSTPASTSSQDTSTTTQELVALLILLRHKVEGTFSSTATSHSSLNKEIRKAIKSLRESPTYVAFGPCFKNEIEDLDKRVTRWGHFVGVDSPLPISISMMILSASNWLDNAERERADV